jgi:broad-specificity NMP kinase
MNASIVCVVCCDEDNHVVFSCLTPSCEYRLCSDCIKFAFQDGTGKNSEKCPSCNEGGNAIRMVKAVVGPIGVRAVENELRSTVEFDVKERLEVRKVKSANLSVICDDARRIFNELTEEMNLKCPRCKQAFYDYDGCNALYCGSCECRFCAICLKDCGSDAHPHVRAEHGNLFDKEMFNASKAEREKAVVQRVLKKLQGKPDELKQLVKNHLDKAGVMAQKIDERVSCNLIKAFLGEAKESLRAAVRTDRLSLLSDGSKDRRREDIITSHDISPRCVPDNYRLKLLHQNANVFLISLEMRDSEGNWAPQRLENSEKETKCADDKQTTPIPDCLTNLTFSLKCAVVAIKGRNRLYQTRRSEKDDKKDQDRISIGFTPVDSNGDIAERNEALPFMHDDLTILGLNPNLRINLLNEHVQKTEDEDLISDPIRHVIGAGTPCPLLENMHTVAPETLNQLNELQRKVAHPLCVKSAMEVAGPPGTGKTKTITELTRSLLECTDYGIIVLSERNGAIDAIAEKFASNCLVLDSKHRIRSISDVPLWLSVMTYGSASVGSYTKMFTLKEKMM